MSFLSCFFQRIFACAFLISFTCYGLPALAQTTSTDAPPPIKAKSYPPGLLEFLDGVIKLYRKSEGFPSNAEIEKVLGVKIMVSPAIEDGTYFDIKGKDFLHYVSVLTREEKKHEMRLVLDKSDEICLDGTNIAEHYQLPFSEHPFERIGATITGGAIMTRTKDVRIKRENPLHLFLRFANVNDCLSSIRLSY